MTTKKANQSAGAQSQAGVKDTLEQVLHRYLDDFIAHNRSAKIVTDGLRVIGTGFWPVIDHITFRTHDVEQRAKEFLAYGYACDTKLGVIEYENWWAKVYRKAGYPVIFIDQAFEGKRGKGSLIPDWVDTFGDQALHHVAICVEDIEKAIYYLEKQSVVFGGKIVGGKGTDLRQIFTAPEMRGGKAFSVLELAERHHGYQGFLPPQADGLMESTRVSY